jgi:hypothetical protein
MEHVIHCAPERLWELYFDNAFNVEMYERGLGFPSCKVLERREQGDRIIRRMAMIPKIDMPAAVAKLVGDKVGFEERADYDRKAGLFRFQIILAAFDKARVEGTMRVVPHGDGQCKRIVDFEVEVKMFGVGGMIEKTAMDNNIAGWNRSAAWINECLARTP